MTADEFRSLALSFPAAVEAEHMGHADFCVRGKIFATLAPDEVRGMVKLTPEQQTLFVRNEPDVFQPVKGAWGQRGCTHATDARRAAVRRALMPPGETRRPNACQETQR